MEAAQASAQIRKLLEPVRFRILRFFFSRTVVVGLLLILQVAAFIAAGIFLSSYLTYLAGATVAITAAMAVYLVNTGHSPVVKICWIVTVAVLPVFATLLYLYLWSNLGYRKVRRRLERIVETSLRTIPPDPQALAQLAQSSPQSASVVRYVNRLTGHSIHPNTGAQYFPTGTDMWEQLLADLRQAEDFIFMEYFIIEEGVMWGTILSILEERAAAGVEVRVLYDGTCEFTTLPSDYPRRLAQIGVQSHMFARVRAFMSSHYNYRDHRKVTVIDGKIAYNGGANLADEYIDMKQRYGYWKDTGVRLTGAAVDEFTLMFLRMWNADTTQDPKQIDYQRYLGHYERTAQPGYVMPYPQDPFGQDLVAENVYLDLINAATRYVYISSPYLILDFRLESALCFAARRGVDVSIVIPYHYDYVAAAALAHTHYPALLRAGVKIFEYAPGYSHAKMMVSDDIRAIVGSINLDYRSLYHHFECATYMMDHPVIADVKADMEKMIADSRAVHAGQRHRHSWFLRPFGALIKVLSPLI